MSADEKRPYVGSRESDEAIVSALNNFSAAVDDLLEQSELAYEACTKAADALCVIRPVLTPPTPMHEHHRRAFETLRGVLGVCRKNSEVLAKWHLYIEPWVQARLELDDALAQTSGAARSNRDEGGRIH